MHRLWRLPIDFGGIDSKFIFNLHKSKLATKKNSIYINVIGTETKRDETGITVQTTNVGY